MQGQASISFSDSTNIVPDQFYGFKKATKADPGGTQMALNIMGVDGYGVINSPKLERQEILKIVMSGNYVITEQRYHKLFVRQSDKIKRIQLTLIGSYLCNSLELLSHLGKKIKV